jgi:hypothetical protein
MLQKREVVIVYNHHFVILSSYAAQATGKEEIFDLCFSSFVIGRYNQSTVTSRN